MSELTPAFVLHTRPYRDTSMLVDFFTREEGRITAVAKGVRRQRSALKPLLQPFIALLVSLIGKSDLKTLRDVDTTHHRLLLSGANIMIGFYLNELIMRLLHQHDPHPLLFDAYEQALSQLASGDDTDVKLRLFEKILLKEMGYELPLTVDVQTGESIKREAYYQYQHGVGFVKSLQTDRGQSLFHGRSLLALHQNALVDADARQDAKRLMRLVFNHLFAGKPLKTRELM